MTERRGERIGWLGGWAGSFLWLLALSIILLAQGNILAGVAGLVMYLLAMAALVLVTPWRFPATSYWLLMLPLLLLLLAGVVLMYFVYLDASQGAVPLWSLSWVLLLFLPLLTMGRRTWQQGEGN